MTFTSVEKTNSGTGNEKKSGYILFGIFVLVIVLFFGNFHIVFGSSNLIVARPYFGFSDIIADVKMCTSVPYTVAMSAHGSLCSALQDIGNLESGSEFSNRIESETRQRIEQSFSNN